MVPPGGSVCLVKMKNLSTNVTFHIPLKLKTGSGNDIKPNLTMFLFYIWNGMKMEWNETVETIKSYWVY